MRNQSGSPPVHVHVSEDTPVHVHVKSQGTIQRRTSEVRGHLLFQGCQQRGPGPDQREVLLDRPLVGSVFHQQVLSSLSTRVRRTRTSGRCVPQ